MGFVKYSVVELGIEEDVPGWVKQAKEATPAELPEGPKDANSPANKKTEDQEENSPKEK